MCRWLVYHGEPIQMSKAVLDAQHSLVAQSRNSPLGAETVNGDGFGVGWYPADDALGTRPALFRSLEPAWFDENLREITEAVESPLFFAHVRAAGGPPIQQTNCHPFRFDDWLFMHNGFLPQFSRMRRDLMLALDPEFFPHIRGTTDSEVLFYLALTYGLRDDPVEGMRRAIRKVEEVGHSLDIQFPMQGTFAISDGSTVWAIRYSTMGRTRSLFHSIDVEALREMYPDNERLRTYGMRARLIVSEPLTDLPGAFVEVPESTVAIVDESGYRHDEFAVAA